MSDEQDPLLRALGEVERDYQIRYPKAWEPVVAGKRPAGDVAAEREGVDPPAEHAAFVAMFSKPVSEDEVAGLVGRVAAVVSTMQVESAPPPGARPRPKPVVVVPLLRRKSTLIGVTAIGVAIAAAVLLWQTPPELAPRGDRIAYALTVRNETVKTTRSSDAAETVAKYRGDSQIDWVLSPATPQRAAIELRVEAMAADGEVTVLMPATTRSQEGALRLRGTFGELLPLAPGAWTLRLFVGTKEALARGEGETVGEGMAIEVIASE